ncbi:hypothetical protein [Rubidibacter lacunae]|nr:hypothetical protein [Rubidibacter lacunae]
MTATLRSALLATVAAIAFPLPALAQTNSDFDEFAQKVARIGQNLEYYAAYQLQATDFSASIKHWFADAQMRIDSVALDDIEVQGPIRIYINNGTIVNCVAPDGEWLCLQLPSMQDVPDGAEFSNLGWEAIRTDVESYRGRVKKLENRTIAGAPTSCFRFDESDEAMVFEVCFTQGGIPLYLGSEGDGYFTSLTATEFQTSVEAGTFELPAVPQSLPNFPQ